MFPFIVIISSIFRIFLIINHTIYCTNIILYLPYKYTLYKFHFIYKKRLDKYNDIDIIIYN